MNRYEPKTEHKFTFGLWTIGNIGPDPFGEPGRPIKSPFELLFLLNEINHDDGSVTPFLGPYQPGKAKAIKEARFDRSGMGSTGLAREKLDPLTIELLLGVD